MGYNLDLEIELSRAKLVILSLPEDWDGSGASQISQETWERTISFLRKLCLEYESVSKHNFPVPVLSACGDGSIDILWRESKYKLLVNIQPENNESGFYGEGLFSISGKFSPSTQFPMLDFLIKSCRE